MQADGGFNQAKEQILSAFLTFLVVNRVIGDDEIGVFRKHTGSCLIWTAEAQTGCTGSPWVVGDG